MKKLTLFTLLSLAGPAQADDDDFLMMGSMGPEDISLDYDCEDPEAEAEAWAQSRELLQRYATHSGTVVVGRVLTTRRVNSKAGPHQVASIMVEKAFRGEASILYEFYLDLPEAYPDGTAPKLIEGYRVLVFVDERGWLMDGNALFAVEGGWAWRSRRPDVFLRPSIDRMWLNEMDPSDSYTYYSLAEIRQALAPPIQTETERKRGRGRKPAAG